MACHYHPEREGTDTCAICGKSICKECGLEIAGKIYCKDCLESIVGIELDNRAQSAQKAPEPVKTEPARLNKQPAGESVYQQVEEAPKAPQQEQPTHEIKQIREDSPYNIRDTAAPEPESSYLHESEVPPKAEEVPPQAESPQITQRDDYIYPDHSYEPEPTSARQELEDKYERYLDDLYFEDEEVPLDEQLAKDEEEYGSLTRRPYAPRETPAVPQKPASSLKERKKPKREETPEEMEARLRAEIMAEKDEKDGKKKKKGRKSSESNIHNINYKDEKEPMGVVDILLTVVLILVILVVIYYIIYIFILSASYPTFMDAVYALSNPQNVINNILSPQ